jgi:pimeloyl-ACP methyl ester carboxylesterase
MVGFLASLRAYDQHAVLAEIQARTVVVSGGMDPLIPPAHGRDLANGIRGAKHLHLRWAGHMLPRQAPHVLNDAIRWVLAVDHRQHSIGELRSLVSGREATPA